MNTSLLDKMFLRVLLIVFMTSVACGQDRKIKETLNPGCEKCGDDKTLIYIRADGPKDSMHVVWDFTNGVPCFMFLISDLNSSLVFKWNDTKIVDINCNGTAKFALVNWIYKLYEYNDEDDLGHMSATSPYHSYSLEHARWARVALVASDKEVTLHINGHFRHKPGTIGIKLQYLPYTDYAKDLPHLIHTANSSLVDISLVNLTASRDFNCSRFALDLALMSSDIQQKESLHVVTRKSLDDEHTPGVFEITEIKTPKSYYGDEGGFLQFRPVAYTDPKREVSSSTSVRISSFNETSAMKSIPFRGQGLFDTDKYDIWGLQSIVSFGMPGDGFYQKHNYTAWSYTAGYGAPPVEGFSLFVIIIISIGLGVPVLLALSGIIYVIVRRYKQRNAPQRFTDDE